MKVPVRWLKELVPTNLTAREIGHRLTMAGLEAEAITEIGANWDNIFVGLVERVERHPNADRLVLATVNLGEQRLTVVTGAPNVAAGQKVPFALSGARLFDGHSAEAKLITLKPNTIRGVRSEGMICSEKELGLSDEHEGILVLDEAAPVGLPLRDYLGNEVIELEITPNLAHDFSMVGIAREIAALTGSTARSPRLADLTDSRAGGSLVTVEAPDLCPRYAGVVMENIRVEPSPAWMQRRLSAAGVRPINNIVDVTNYVMLELGQPMHAFDREFLNEGRIVVRRAEPEEKIETLDHTVRDLTPEMLVIADADRAVAIAGVMGGIGSEITNETTKILLESASFNMFSVRRTSRALRLRTESSARFERGIDPNLPLIAARRAVALIQEMLPEVRVTAVADIYPVPVRPRELSMPFAEIERLLGISYPETVVLDILQRLEFSPEILESEGIKTISVQVPTYRADVTNKADLVEEVARITGYETLPERLPERAPIPAEIDPMRRLERVVQDTLVAAGLSEIITYPMLNEQDLIDLNAAGNGLPSRYGYHARPEVPLVTAVNPLRSEWEMMRPTMLPALLKNVAENVKFNPSVGVFETGRVYLPVSPEELPNERRTLGIGLAGQRQLVDLYHEARVVDYFDIKGIIDALVRRIGVIEPAFRAITHPSLHPGRAAEVTVKGQPVGILGELHPSVIAHFGIASERVGIAEIDLLALLEAGIEPWRFQSVSRFQPIEQDFAIVVDEHVPAADVAAAIRAGAGVLGSDVRLFDIYRGQALGPGKKSLAYRVTLAAPDRALAEHEIERIRGRIAAQVERRVGGTLRG